MVNDISRAFFHARAKREVFVQLPNGDMRLGEEGMCGRLKCSMYGTRDAAQNWYEECSGQLKQIGFEQVKASPCIFYHKERGLCTYVHGDDYVTMGMPEHLGWMKAQLEKKYTVKTQTLGPGEKNQQQIKLLNRVVTWHDNFGIHCEADPRHVEIILKQLKMEDAKIVTTLGTKDEGKTSENSHVALGDQDATKYRALVARCNYLSPDRRDIAFSVKELARAMSAPTQGDWQRLKRFARYIKGKPRMVVHYKWQEAQPIVTTYSDADWAGCRDTRKSTTGGCIKIGSRCVKGWSKTQALIALSSGESEFYAALKAWAETLGLLSMLKDMAGD